MRVPILMCMSCVWLMLLPVSTASATIFFIDTFEDGTFDKWEVVTQMKIAEDPGSGNRYATNAIGWQPGFEPHARHFKDGGVGQTGTNYPGASGIIHGYAAMRLNAQTVNTKSFARGETQFFRNDGPDYNARGNTAYAQFRMFNNFSHTKSVLKAVGRQSDAEFVLVEHDVVMSETPSATDPERGEWIALRTTFDTINDTIDVYYAKGGNQVSDWVPFPDPNGAPGNPIVSGVDVFGIGNVVLYNQNFAYNNGDTPNEGPDVFDYDNVVVADENFTPDQVLSGTFGLCGELGFRQGDFNKDCYVDDEDLKILARDYLGCTHPEDPSCAQ